MITIIDAHTVKDNAKNQRLMVYIGWSFADLKQFRTIRKQLERSHRTAIDFTYIEKQ